MAYQFVIYKYKNGNNIYIKKNDLYETLNLWLQYECSSNTDDDDSVIFDFQALLVAEDGIPPQMFFFPRTTGPKELYKSPVRCPV